MVLFIFKHTPIYDLVGAYNSGTLHRAVVFVELQVISAIITHNPDAGL